MSESLPSGSAPWFGLDPATLRFLEIHQARAVGSVGRECRDLGDSFLLHSPSDRDPFFNRLVALRWPESPGRFDHRLAEALSLFTSLDRRPYLWIVPEQSTPPDIVSRLLGFGFRDIGGGYRMLFVGERGTSAEPMLPGTELVHWQTRARGGQANGAARILAETVAAGFGVDATRLESLEADMGGALLTDVFHGYVLRVDGQAVATGQRFTFEGASYLSSIATRPNWRGRGYGTAVTEALVRDSIAEGCRYVYLGVHAENERAIRLYERLGFAILGRRTAEMLLG